MGMMQTKTLAQTIKKIPLFAYLSPSQIQSVLGICQLQDFEALTVVYTANAPSNDMHILLSGELSVVNEQGMRLARVYPVTTVGEMGLITRQPRSATVETSKPSKMIMIQRVPFDLLLRSEPDLQTKVYRNIIDILCAKISGDNVRVRDHLLEKVEHQRDLRAERRQTEALKRLLAEVGMSEADVTARMTAAMVPDRMRVLIVDDEATICMFVRQALHDYEVDEANDGVEALSAVESAPPDLVITDIRMPHMDGTALLKGIRSKLPNVPVIALSGFVEAADLEAYDFDGFIRKPFELTEFRTLVDQTVGKPDESASDELL